MFNLSDENLNYMLKLSVIFFALACGVSLMLMPIKGGIYPHFDRVLYDINQNVIEARKPIKDVNERVDILVQIEEQNVRPHARYIY